MQVRMMMGEEVRNECSVIDHRKIRDSRIYPKDGIAAHQLLIRLGATQHWEKKGQMEEKSCALVCSMHL
jgi:hypothetical protein